MGNVGIAAAAIEGPEQLLAGPLVTGGRLADSQLVPLRVSKHA
jgi:hypothetical protein